VNIVQHQSYQIRFLSDKSIHLLWEISHVFLWAYTLITHVYIFFTYVFVIYWFFNIYLLTWLLEICAPGNITYILLWVPHSQENLHLNMLKLAATTLLKAPMGLFHKLQHCNCKGDSMCKYIHAYVWHSTLKGLIWLHTKNFKSQTFKGRIETTDALRLRKRQNYYERTSSCSPKLRSIRVEEGRIKLCSACPSSTLFRLITSIKMRTWWNISCRL